jgi:hypothetical protein
MIRAEAQLTNLARALRDALDQSIANGHPPMRAQRKQKPPRQKKPRSPKPPPTARSVGAVARLVAAFHKRPNDWRFIARRTYGRNGFERKAKVLAAYAAKAGRLKRIGPGRFEPT